MFTKLLPHIKVVYLRTGEIVGGGSKFYLHMFLVVTKPKCHKALIEPLLHLPSDVLHGL